jgi:hypothetical protein
MYFIQTGVKLMPSISNWVVRGIFWSLGLGLSLGIAAPGLAANLVLNGSFEEIALPNNTWTVFPWSPPAPLPHNLTSIPGWNLAPGSRIEIQRYVAGSPAAGFQLLELDADFTQKGSIYQDILTEPNQTYLLKFAFSPRPSTGISDNILQIKWGNQIVDTLSENGIGLLDTVWKYYTYKLPATSNTTRLEFSDRGTPNHVGTYIDDVTVESEPVPEPTTVLGTLAFGAVVSSWRMKRKQQQKVLNSTVG